MNNVNVVITICLIVYYIIVLHLERAPQFCLPFNIFRCLFGVLCHQIPLINPIYRIRKARIGHDASNCTRGFKTQ